LFICLSQIGRCKCGANIYVHGRQNGIVLHNSVIMEQKKKSQALEANKLLIGITLVTDSQNRQEKQSRYLEIRGFYGLHEREKGFGLSRFGWVANNREQKYKVQLSLKPKLEQLMAAQRCQTVDEKK
jgi:hypothetical protein